MRRRAEEVAIQISEDLQGDRRPDRLESHLSAPGGHRADDWNPSGSTGALVEPERLGHNSSESVDGLLETERIAGLLLRAGRTGGAARCAATDETAHYRQVRPEPTATTTRRSPTANPEYPAPSQP